MSLVARTRRLDHDIDLLAVAGADGVLVARDGVGLAGRGMALEIDVDDVREAQATLSAIDVDDEVGGPGTGAVAFGAWPFLPGPGRCLRVPEVIVGRDDRGSRWVTTVGDVDPTPVLLDVEPAPVLPERITVQATQPVDDWCAAVVAGRDAVRAGELRKVVLARELVVRSDRPFDRPGVLRRLEAAFPGCVLAAIDGFVCASPEILVARHGDVVRSHPLAGTAPRGGDPTADARLAAGAPGVGEGPGRAPGHHRLRPRDPAALVLLPRRGGRALRRRPWPTSSTWRTMVEGRLSTPPRRCWSWSRRCTPRRRSAATRGTWPSP